MRVTAPTPRTVSFDHDVLRGRAGATALIGEPVEDLGDGACLGWSPATGSLTCTCPPALSEPNVKKALQSAQNAPQETNRTAGRNP